MNRLYACKQIHIDTRFKMHSDGNIIKISLRGVYIKFKYLMRNPRLSSTFKRNISLTKILANALFKQQHVYFDKLLWIIFLILNKTTSTPQQELLPLLHFGMLLSNEHSHFTSRSEALCWSRSLAGEVIRKGWDGRDEKSHSSPKYRIHKNPFKN